MRDQRALSDPLQHVAKANISTDRRHDRRALSDEEFQRLLQAARHGKRIEGITGPDRVMLYILAAWTGLRKGELGSLTQRSLHLHGTPPTVTVGACYSKRRRQDTQVLHPELARQLSEWLAGKGHKSESEPLFRISGRVPGGVDRKTHKMIQRDLVEARRQWLSEATTARDRLDREQSDFLCHVDRAGRYADFHSLRHLFITNLERAGVRPKVAQSLARHSDIRLTLDVYTHADLADQMAGIAALPGPPSGA